MKRLIVFMIMISPLAQADSYIRYGLGISRSAEKSSVETKMVAIGASIPLGKHLTQQFEAGLWTDTGGNGRRGSPYGSWSVGVMPQAGCLYMQGSWGLGAIASPDSYLGGWFQFFHDLGVGFRDDKGVGIGLYYKHVSSAGIWPQNIGRDFVTVRLSIPW